MKGIYPSSIVSYNIITYDLTRDKKLIKSLRKLSKKNKDKQKEKTKK